MKLFKSKIFIFVLGLVIAGSISVFAYQMNASQITYEPKDTSWNVKNVKAAIDDLKTNASNSLTLTLYTDNFGNRSNTSSYISSIRGYKKVKIDSIEAVQNSNSCSARAWDCKTNGYVNLSENGEYVIVTDEHNLCTIELVADNNTNGRCKMVLIYSK